MKKTLPRKDGKDFTGEKLHYLQASPDGSCAPNSLAIIFAYYIICGRYRNHNIMLDELICVWNLWYQGTDYEISEEGGSIAKRMRFEYIIRNQVEKSQDSERLITPVLRLYSQIWWLEIKALTINLKELIQAGATSAQVMAYTECADHVTLAKQAIQAYDDKALPGAPISATGYPYPTPAGWFTMDAMADIAQLVKMDITYGLNANFSREYVIGTYQCNDAFIKELKTWFHHSQECEIHCIDAYIRDLKDVFRRTFWQLNPNFASLGKIDTGHNTLLAAIVNRAGQHFDPALPDHKHWEMHEQETEVVKRFLDNSPRVDLATISEHVAIKRALKASEIALKKMAERTTKKVHNSAKRTRWGWEVIDYSEDRTKDQKSQTNVNHGDQSKISRIVKLLYTGLLQMVRICGAILLSMDPDLRIIMTVALVAMCHGISFANTFSLPIAVMATAALSMYMMASFPPQQPRQDAWISEKSLPILTMLSKAGDYLLRCAPLAALVVSMAYVPVLAVINMLLSAMKKCFWDQYQLTTMMPTKSAPLQSKTLLQYAQQYALPLTKDEEKTEIKPQNASNQCRVK